MIRERILAISTPLILAALSGAAHAGPTITNYNYWPNEVGPSSYYRSAPTKSESRRALANQRGRPAVQSAPSNNSGQYGCRYQGGPKFPMACSTRP